ncbi:MAG: glycosyltransferase family 2 protein [Gammaproteobacteria bacterium]|nr:glycosyltransferase family 2 protein [Gammaproteobacteria bacterium]
MNNSETLLTGSGRERPADPLLSIMVPVFNEAESIDIFLSALCSALSKAGIGHYEILFINDGSSDATLPLLLERSHHIPELQIINLSRNFGKEAALTAGFDYAQGDMVLPIDVDLQDPPELIGRFIELWRQGYDMVYGIRGQRTSDTFLKHFTAHWFYRLFNHSTQIGIPENVGDFRLLDKRVVEILRQLPERNRFMKGLFAWVGFNSIGVPYTRTSRSAGETKWNYWKLWNFALDGIISFSSLPLRLWTYLGAVLAMLSFFYMLAIITRVILLGVDVPGYASLMSVILFLGGIQLLSLGIIGEYLARLFVEAKGRPIYIVEGVYGQNFRNNEKLS